MHKSWILMQMMIKNAHLAVATICLLATLHQTFAANILMVFPHIYYSHFKGTSALARELSSRGHNVTFVTPYPGELEMEYTNITEISIGDIIDPIKESKDDFLKNDNSWDSYWSSLKYSKEIGYQYSEKILENKFIKQLIKSNASSFDLVIVEDVAADALAVLSHVFNCPLVVVLSEPVSMFYDNYFSDNTMWKQYNEFRNAHLWVIKELYRKWFVLTAQNQLVKEVIPEAPHLGDILYQTSLVLMPSYPTLGNMVPKYQNVKQIGGFNDFGASRKLPQELEKFYNDPSGMIVVSNNLPAYVQDQLRIFFFGNVDLMLHMIHFTSDVVDVIGNSKVKLFIGDGDVYDTGLAVLNQVPVLSISTNIWHQRFLIDSLVEKKMAAQVSVDSLDTPEFNSLVHQLLKSNDGHEDSLRNASEVLKFTETSPIDEAIFWIEYVLKFEGAPHLRPYDLEWTVHNHLIIIIIVLAVLDVALFLFFYWFIKHFPRLFGKCCFKIKNKRTTNISYIKL